MHDISVVQKKPERCEPPLLGPDKKSKGETTPEHYLTLFNHCPKRCLRCFVTVHESGSAWTSAVEQRSRSRQKMDVSWRE